MSLYLLKKSHLLYSIYYVYILFDILLYYIYKSCFYMFYIIEGRYTNYIINMLFFPQKI